MLHRQRHRDAGGHAAEEHAAGMLGEALDERRRSAVLGRLGADGGAELAAEREQRAEQLVVAA